MTEQQVNQIYTGNIYHQRFSPKAHHFNYQLFMLALDVKQMEHKQGATGVFGFSFLKPLCFNEKDYLRSEVKSEPKTLTERITDKVQQLNGKAAISRITMLAQVRCFGIYFSPANFYFCYDKNDVCEQMLVEVSNTPWHERHYYLVDITKEDVCEKEFQVSPFMDLNMRYHWRVIPPELDNKLFIEIKNYNTQGDMKKVFEVGLAMQPKPLTSKNIFKTWCSLPVMTIKIIASIYWQALRLFIKRIPFIGYQTLTDKKRS